VPAPQVLPVALIVGVGSGLSASLARRLHREGYRVVLAARDIGKIADLATETDARCITCDASNPDEVDALFAGLDGPLRVAVYNPSARERGPLIDLDREGVRHALHVTAFGAFLIGQAAARAMLAEAPENGVRARSCSPALRQG
jgi:NAD(P)-dependent dehydrogenase (short-subunit alcohol dehydrogenase family)